jgi:hypothetical protein
LWLSAGGFARMMDLPVRNNNQVDVVQIRVEEETPHRDGDAEAKRWSITVSFEFSGLGPLHAKLLLVGHTLSASLWAEQPATLHLLESHVEHLRQRFAEAKLETATIQCFPGRPLAPKLQTDAEELVDLKV